MIKGIRPLHDYLMVKPLKEETKAGTFYQAVGTKNYTKAEVLKGGSAKTIKRKDDKEVQNGDIVFYKQSDAYLFDEEQADVFLIDKRDLLALSPHA